MAEECKKFGQLILDILECLLEERAVTEKIVETKEQLRSITTLAETISGSLKASPEDLANMIEREMTAMDTAIEEAANRIQVYCLFKTFNLISSHRHIKDLFYIYYFRIC